jgi:hypothetical protein
MVAIKVAQTIAHSSCQDGGMGELGKMLQSWAIKEILIYF